MPGITLHVSPAAHWGQSIGFSQNPSAQRPPAATPPEDTDGWHKLKHAMFSPRLWRSWQALHWSTAPSAESRHSAVPRESHHISVQLMPLSVHVLHPSNQVWQPASMQLPHWSRPGLVLGQAGPHVPGASIIMAMVLTHSSSGAQRLCMLGGIMPPQLEPAGENATHSFGPSYWNVVGRQKPAAQSASVVHAPEAAGSAPPAAWAAEQSASRQEVPSSNAVQYGVPWRKQAMSVQNDTTPFDTPHVLQPSFHDVQSCGMALPAEPVCVGGGSGSTGCCGEPDDCWQFSPTKPALHMHW